MRFSHCATKYHVHSIFPLPYFLIDLFTFATFLCRSAEEWWSSSPFAQYWSASRGKLLEFPSRISMSSSNYPCDNCSFFVTTVVTNVWMLPRGGGGCGALPSNWLLGMCRWMVSHWTEFLAVIFYLLVLPLKKTRSVNAVIADSIYRKLPSL